MSKVSIRSGIEVPHSLARDAMFILHGRDEKDVHGIYVGNKADEPVCIQNLRVVFTDDKIYQILTHDKFVYLDGKNQILTLPDPKLINNGHEVRILLGKPHGGGYIKKHDGKDTDVYLSMPRPIHLIYSSLKQSWIEL